jgi:hypothetical protein
MMIPLEFECRPIRSSVMSPLTSAGERAAFPTGPPRSGNAHIEISDTHIIYGNTSRASFLILL